MSRYYTAEHEEKRKEIKAFFDQEVHPYIDQWDKEKHIPKSIWKKMGERGYLGFGFPEEYGGTNRDFWYNVLLVEEVSKIRSGGFNAAFGITQMALPYIHKYGSDFLKNKYLKAVIQEDMNCCMGITEHGGGSDVANAKTTAIKNYDHYIVNGSKTFITNGILGDFYVTVVKTDPNAGFAGFSLLIIDADAEGITKNPIEKMGWHASDTAELGFNNVKVPVENLIGMEGLQYERLSMALGSINDAVNALEYTIQQKEKLLKGADNQQKRHDLAQMVADVELSKQFVYQCRKNHEEGEYMVLECSVAKVNATALAERIIAKCIEIMDDLGVREDHFLARMYRDSRIGTIGGGSQEIMFEIISKMVIDDKKYDAA
ncbi:acyl-CoA dehydrogenase family protein [Faecalibacter sp. LW9]|uniref:acyl-CoA dehydrogenase family protein n=1 Tax=Faecalibacter sp. LW9 TaxID=3103144 RepID=UPI002AFDF4F4|nr:acyl-CoA dehydrogenase family protein [Faecalibacter sp. LW9]